jgi:hydrogenase maturation protease
LTIHIIGIGNRWATDDGVGHEVMQQLRTRLKNEPAGFGAQIESFGFPLPDLALMDALENCSKAVFVDAVVSGAPPGTVYILEWQPGIAQARGVERASSHGFGLREVLELAAALGRLPEQVLICGIEVASTEPGERLTPEVAAAVPEAVDTLYQLLQRPEN